MNYHIIIQDKFFNDYIEDIYRIHEEDNNIVLVRGDVNGNPFFHTDRPVEYIGNNPDIIAKRLGQLSPDDHIIVAWYDLFIGEIICRLNLKNELYVYPLGADFYCEPEWWHDKWVYDPMTYRKYMRVEMLPRFFSKRPWRWYRGYRWFVFKHEMKKQYERKLETIRRIDYLIMPEHSQKSYEFVKRLYPTLRAKRVCGTFNQNVNNAVDYGLKPIPQKNEALNVLLGNSSDPTGNHLDAIMFLAGRLEKDSQIYCLLSYGDSASRDWTIAYGRKVFGDRFHPVLDFMQKDEFVSFMLSMDIVIEYHNRSQAAGNIITALTLGKPVFMKPTSTFFSHLNAIGVSSVHSVRQIGECDLREIIKAAQNNKTENTRLIRLEYSDETRLKHLKALLCN